VGSCIRVDVSVLCQQMPCCAARVWHNPLQLPAPLHNPQTLYFLSSFFNQFGPNCTSFLVAGEVRGCV